MPIALRDAPRGGQDGARLDKAGDEIDDTQRNTGAADFHGCDHNKNPHVIVDAGRAPVEASA